MGRVSWGVCSDLPRKERDELFVKETVKKLPSVNRLVVTECSGPELQSCKSPHQTWGPAITESSVDATQAAEGSTV